MGMKMENGTKVEAYKASGERRRPSLVLGSLVIQDWEKYLDLHAR